VPSTRRNSERSRAHFLSTPRSRATPIAGEVDAVWPDHRLIAELDGYDAHTTRRAFENDRAKDRELVVAGWRVVRITWRQLEHQPERLASQLRALMRDTVQAP
jgi:very-short-patch-repair endonuclease